MSLKKGLLLIVVSFKKPYSELNVMRQKLLSSCLTVQHYSGHFTIIPKPELKGFCERLPC